MSRGYKGVDFFRVVAALLVVAVHTSPLLIFGEIPDFIFSRVFSRVAVPFFLAATGFFLLSPYMREKALGIAPIGRFLRKVTVLYGLSILLYVPINIYAEHLDIRTTALELLKMFFVDGTMYHLWYLPAAILGVVLVWALMRYAGLLATTVISIALYGIGLLGDSYYGLIEQIPFVRGLYETIFTVSSYTRNGLFYAPIFLVAGVWAARLQTKEMRGRYVRGFVLCLIAMTAEGVLLHALNWQRHDSMYLLLPACVFFLFRWLLTYTGASDKRLRDVSLVVYLIHPLMIIGVRGIAKAFPSMGALVENSLMYYSVVCVLSLGAGIAFLWLSRHCKKKYRQRYPDKRAWVEIDMKAVEHNVEVLREFLPKNCKLMPAVKADAYGLGAVTLSRALNRMGIDSFCVASLEEGIELRENGVEGEILILGYTHPDSLFLLRKYNLMQTVVDYEYAKTLAQHNKKLAVHVKIDTGMHRLGERSEEIDRIKKILALDNLHIKGIFSQLSCCDSVEPEDILYTETQIACFQDVLDGPALGGRIDLPTHIQCSYGIYNYPDLSHDYVRPGLAIFGIVEKDLCMGDTPDLRPIFQVKSRVALVKSVQKGERVGYGKTFIAPSDKRIAVIAIGYGDGLPRALSNGSGSVLVNGQAAPIVGNICMDQAMIDVTHIKDIQPGNEVVVIGEQGENAITVDSVAKQTATIPNEIVSRLGRRLERKYLTS